MGTHSFPSLDVVKAALQSDRRIRMPEFGVFSVSREGHNWSWEPSERPRGAIPPVIHFRAEKRLKDWITHEEGPPPPTPGWSGLAEHLPDLLSGALKTHRIPGFGRFSVVRRAQFITLVFKVERPGLAVGPP